MELSYAGYGQCVGYIHKMDLVAQDAHQPRWRCLRQAFILSVARKHVLARHLGECVACHIRVDTDSPFCRCEPLVVRVRDVVFVGVGAHLPEALDVLHGGRSVVLVAK